MWEETAVDFPEVAGEETILLHRFPLAIGFVERRFKEGEAVLLQ